MKPGRNSMSIIRLDDIRSINEKIDQEVEFYTKQLEAAEKRLSLLESERKMLVELLHILENERNK